MKILSMVPSALWVCLLASSSPAMVAGGRVRVSARNLQNAFPEELDDIEGIMAHRDPVLQNVAEIGNENGALPISSWQRNGDESTFAVRKKTTKSSEIVTGPDCVDEDDLPSKSSKSPSASKSTKSPSASKSTKGPSASKSTKTPSASKSTKSPSSDKKTGKSTSKSATASPSVSVEPTAMPTEKPTSAPTMSPAPSIMSSPSSKSTKSSKSTSKSVRRCPSAAPSTSSAPSVSPAPTVSPAPSAAPSVSQAPSTSPAPSEAPSVSSAPSASPAPTFTSAPTAVPSVSLEPSLSESPTETATIPTEKGTRPPVSSTAAPTMSPAPTVSPAPSVSPAPTVSPTISPAPTVSPAPSVSPAPTVAPTISPAPTVSPAPSVSPAPTVSPTISPAPTVSPAPTTSPAPSATPTTSPAPTVSPAPSTTPTTSPAPSVSPGPTATNAPSPVNDRSGEGTTSPAGDGIDVGENDINPPPSEEDCFNVLFQRNSPTIAATPRVPIEFTTDFDVSSFTNGTDLVDKLNEDVGETTVEDGTTGQNVTFQGIVSAWVMGCEDMVREVIAEVQLDISTGRKLAERNLNLERWLQAPRDTSIGFVTMEEFSSNGDCPSQPTEENLGCANMGTAVNIYEPGDDVNNALLQSRILEAFAQIGGLLGLFGIEFDIEEPDVQPPNSVNRATDTADDDRVNAGIIVGVAAAGLALLLLLILLVRRKRSSDEMSHLKLEEDEDEFLNEMAGTVSTGTKYNNRNTHVVGEADSVVTGWTGYTRDLNTSNDSSAMGPYGAGAAGALAHPHGDVHICSSATCDVCERRRQQGLQFIPSGTPPRPSALPTGASRDYTANDTVEL